MSASRLFVPLLVRACPAACSSPSRKSIDQLQFVPTRPRWLRTLGEIHCLANLPRLVALLPVCLVALPFICTLSAAQADNAAPLVSHPAYDYYPKWSPDGQTIAFISQRSGEPAIWLTPAAGGNPVQLLTGQTGDHHVAWSPDSRTIAFDAYYNDVPDIWTIPVAGGQANRITTNPGSDVHPAWCPRNNRIAYGTFAGLCTMNPDGSDIIHTAATDGGHCCWSPDGERIAYVSEQSGNSDIWIVPAQGGQPVQFTSNPALDEHPCWSPDGLWIVFTSDRAGNRDLWAAPVAGGDPIQITDHPSNDWYPSLSPDQTKIVFTSNRAGSLDLWTIDSTLPKYHPGFHDASAWQTFIPEDYGLGTRLRGYWGAAFDGRYVYFAPCRDGVRPHGKVLRLDSRGQFDDPASWLMFNPYAANVGENPRGFIGAIFDGRYVYFVPNSNNEGCHSEVLRYDSQTPFDDASSWTTFNPADFGLGTTLGGYMNAIFDGRYIYFVPCFCAEYFGEILRYDAAADFQDIASWTSFDPGDAGVGYDPDGYMGGVFDGRYVYFAPLNNNSEWHGEVLRLDSTAPFDAPSSWTTYDPGDADVGAHPDGYSNAVFDGRYVYFVPFLSGDEHHGEVMRYDTTQPFSTPASWTAYDAGDAGLGHDPDGYIGGAYDGRYVYFAPDYNGDGFHSEVLRCDTRGQFEDLASWAAFDPQNHDLCTYPPSYCQAVFDGRYVYFCPSHDEQQNGEFLRYDTAAACFADINRDGAVNLPDLAILLGNYRQPGDNTYSDGDLTGDGAIDLDDLATLLAYYAGACG